MLAKLGFGFFGLAMLACGGATSDGGQSNSVGGAAGNFGGTSSIGGTPSVGGSGNLDNCPATTVNFQVVPAPNSPTQWCIGAPGSCGGQTMTILDASGPLELYTFCQMDCDTCTRSICPPVVCELPFELTSAGSAFIWDGTYVTQNTCGALATACLHNHCAAPGKYQFQVCGFADPDPTSANACSSAASTTSQTCTQITFDYPPTAPVVVTMPLLP